mmetsp:Transcript_3037/g.9020  ORF Transcript_3037/g.9020 Transcript_3037/m.9020 type:complete len:220 (+) Transcript_3037:3586-4245(+)
MNQTFRRELDGPLVRPQRVFLRSRLKGRTIHHFDDRPHHHVQLCHLRVPPPSHVPGNIVLRAKLDRLMRRLVGLLRQLDLGLVIRKQCKPALCHAHSEIPARALRVQLNRPPRKLNRLPVHHLTLPLRRHIMKERQVTPLLRRQTQMHQVVRLQLDSLLETLHRRPHIQASLVIQSTVRDRLCKITRCPGSLWLVAMLLPRQRKALGEGRVDERCPPLL